MAGLQRALHHREPAGRTHPAPGRADRGRPARAGRAPAAPHRLAARHHRVHRLRRARLGPGACARVLLSPPRPGRQGRLEKVRGWRSFATLPAKHVDGHHRGRRRRTHRPAPTAAASSTPWSRRDLEPGWATVRLRVADAEPVEAPIRVIDPAVRFGILSDIDDTVMVTALPRPLLAAWNTFVLDEHARDGGAGHGGALRAAGHRPPGRPGVLPLDRRVERRADADPVPVPAPLPGRPAAAHRLGADGRPLVPQRPGAQAGHPGPAGHRVPRRPVAADRRRRPARPGDLPGVRAAHPENVAGVAIRRLSPTQSVLAGSLPVPNLGGA